VGVFGDSGVGKSKLCNTIVGRNEARTNEVEACTRVPQEILIDKKISIIDFPGTGEDPNRHREYLELYAKWAPNINLALLCIKADDRKYLSTLETYGVINKHKRPSVDLFFVITNCDKILPQLDWDEASNGPTIAQIDNLERKIEDIQKVFQVTRRPILTSSDRYWGFNRIHSLIRNAFLVFSIKNMLSSPRTVQRSK
jgi:predicted GTPase